MPPQTPQQPNSGQPIPPSQPTQSGPAPAPAGFGAGIEQVQQNQAASTLKTTETKLKHTKLFWYISLGLGIIFLAAAIYYAVNFQQSQAANKHKYDDGYKAGTDDQSKKDADLAIKANLTDTRTYTASDELGGFSFQVPKSYSVSTSTGSQDQLVLLANPDKVEQQSLYLALRLTVRNSLFSVVRASYDRDAKAKQNSTTDPEEIQVDGRTAVRYKAKFDRRDKLGTIILIQVRDKTLMLQTDNNDNTTLVTAYNAIVDSMKIP